MDWKTTMIVLLLAAEEWRPVVGFPAYMVSNMGRVKRLAFVTAGGKQRAERILIPWIAKGYFKTTVHPDDKREKQAQVHRLVLQAFVGPPKATEQCCHWDGSKRNNWLTNLRWGNPKDNANDRRRHAELRDRTYGTTALSRRQVEDIRAMPKSVSNGAIARLCGAPQWVVKSLRKGRDLRKKLVKVRVIQRLVAELHAAGLGK